MERFQRLSITLSAKCSENYPFNSAFIAQYLNKTEEYNNYIKKISLDINGYYVNHDIYTTYPDYYDIYNYTTLALITKFMILII